MSKAIKNLIYSVICFLFFVIFAGKSQASTIPTPLIIEITGQPFLISGEAKIDTEILIYLDDKFINYASISAKDKQTETFDYQLPADLTPALHKVIVVAREKTTLVLSPPSPETFFYVGSPPAPTLLEPNEKTITGKVKPIILGLTVTNTAVKIFIDGVYNGQTAILSHPSGTANFAFEPVTNLKLGKHQLQARAADNQGRESDLSTVLNFMIELPMPAPTMYQPVVNNRTVVSRPFIVGLAKNGSTIKVFIDRKYTGQFSVVNHISGTANFAYQPAKSLTKGRHSVYTAATDYREKESIRSNIVYFTVAQPSIAQGIMEEKKENIARINEAQKVKERPLSVSEKEGKIEPPAKSDQESQGIVSQTKEKEPGGAINESKQYQGRWQLNIIIFIIFLVGIVAWLIWVNRELVKERQADESKPAKPESPAESAKQDKDKLL